MRGTLDESNEFQLRSTTKPQIELVEECANIFFRLIHC